MRGRSRAGRTATVLATVAVLAAAGCGSDDDGLPEGLRDVSELDPVGADANGSVDDAVPDGSQPGEPEVGEPEVDPDEEPDGEPGDALEGDDGAVTASGVVVPDSAFQINPDLDLDPDLQRELLQFSLDAYLYAIHALDTLDHDPDVLSTYYAGERLDVLRQSLDRQERDGLRQVNDGTVVEFVRMTTYDGGGAVIALCVTPGSEAGVVDRESGEYTFRVEEPHRLTGSHLALIDVGGGNFDWRIVGSGAPADVTCP